MRTYLMKSKLNWIEFRSKKNIVGYHSNYQIRVYNFITKRMQWHISIKLIENQLGVVLLKTRSQFFLNKKCKPKEYTFTKMKKIIKTTIFFNQTPKILFLITKKFQTRNNPLKTNSKKMLIN